MPERASPAPRKRFPPPTTIATSTPSACTSRISPATRLSTSGSMPYSARPSRASPESLTRMRLQRARVSFIEPSVCHKKNPAISGVSGAAWFLAPACGADLRHHFGDKIRLLLLDAGADLEALERAHRGAGALQQLLDALLLILH